ncbi:MAG: hypothetical protein ACI8ZB_003768 [Desulforhopalus sp.]|jgi:hypothetical protein
MMPSFQLELFADYFQFYIQDDDIKYGDLSDSWTSEAIDNLIAIGNHVVGIGTVRNSNVPVSISISSLEPTLNSEEWDRINKATITCNTGRLVIAGCTDYFPDAVRFDMEPGTYNIIIGYKNLNKISDDKLNGDDSYHLYIYPYLLLSD